jgi:hypothetical protein
MKRIALLFVLLLATIAANAASVQMAGFIPRYTMQCDGTQLWASRAIDYNNTTYLRDVRIVVWNETPTPGTQYAIITVSYDVVPLEGQLGFAAVVGYGRVSSGLEWSGITLAVPAGQAIAIEYKCFGGGSLTFGVSIYYSANP